MANAKLFEIVRKVIVENPERHDQSWWTSLSDWTSVDDVRRYALTEVPEVPENTDRPICQTTACVAGWAAALAAPEGTVISDEGLLIPRFRLDFFDEPGTEEWYDSRESITIERYAIQALDIDPNVGSWLFNPSRSRDEVLWALEWIPENSDDNVYALVSALPDSFGG